jgi:transcriptional regulator with XRE-family HTH domain
MGASNELGEFLRARRARLLPGDVGLPSGTGLRRIPGLRREEVAALAGISIDYYIRLEQGKETNPSTAVLDALTSALRLNDDEHSHLCALATYLAQRPSHRPARRSRTVRPGIRQLLETLRPCPAYVLNATSDILAANPEGLALLAGITDWPADRRNTTRYTFLHPGARTLFADWDKAAVGSVAQLRTAVAADPEAPELLALVEELTAGSPEFAGLWHRYDVRHRRSEQKTFHHPQVGEVTFAYEVVGLDEDGQRMTIYQAAPGSGDHDAMTLLSLAVSE